MMPAAIIIAVIVGWSFFALGFVQGLLVWGLLLAIWLCFAVLRYFKS